MIPTHAEALAAAKRIWQANASGEAVDVIDALKMHTYQVSLELRRVPERQRVETALRISRRILSNTRESMG